MPAPALRPEAILRKRVLAELQTAAARPLTVVTAPAGFGKTIALVQWLEHSGIEYAWLSLTAHDNDPPWFVSRLLAALDQALPGRFEAPQRALDAGADLRDGVIPLLAKAIDARLAIVLDDYHLISKEGCHRVVRALVDALPSHVSLVVASRTQPPLRLGRRRRAGAVGEIRPEQLRFDIDESERLLNGSLGLELDREQIEHIDMRVRGWPVGLALVATALTEQRDRAEFLDALTESQADMAAYLSEEVLDAVRPELQDFLCRTSILGRLNAPLCEALLDPRAGELLAEVRRTNLFLTALDREWIRYHPVFAEALTAQLHRREPQMVAELHRRASLWFEQAEMPEEAIEHALAAGDGPRAAKLLAGCWQALIDDRRYATVRRTLDRLPEDRGELGSFCEALDLLCMSYEGVDVRIIAERARPLAAKHGDDPDFRPLFDDLLFGPFSGDVGRALKLGREAMARRADDPEAQRRLAPVHALVLWWTGDSGAARRLLEPLLDLEQPTTRSIWSLGVLALAAADVRDVELAEQHARASLALIAEIGGQTAPEFAAGPGILADTLRRQGKLEEARHYLSLTLEAEARRPGSAGHAMALVFDAQLALAEGNRRRAQATAHRARAIIDRYPDLGVLDTRLATVESALQAPAENPLLGTEPSAAEMRVLALLDSERTFAEIAGELYLSTQTINSHAHRIYQRLGVHSRRDAVRAARERGLLPAHRSTP